MAENFNIVPVIAVVILIVIIAIVYFFYIKNIISPTSNTITQHTTTTALQSNSVKSSTTIAPNYTYYNTNITAIDLQWYYSGPVNVSGNTCGGAYFETIPSDLYYSSFTWYGGRSGGGVSPPPRSTYNSVENITLGTLFTSGKGCIVTVTNVVVTTPGFNIVSFIPSIPSTIQSNSSEQIIFELKPPNHNFNGPISIDFYETGEKAS